MARCVALLTAGVLALGAAGCAASASSAASANSAGRKPAPAAHAYSGPLYLTAAESRHPGAGAAGNAVRCRTWGDGGSSTAGVYADGATADRADQALDVGRHEGIFGGVQDGLRVAKREPDRVLYALEVHGVVKQAVIVHDGPATKGAGGRGWYVESWATCDYSEFPRSFTDSIGLQIWTDPSGHPVPTTRIDSSRGPAHCGWQSMTFLQLGKAVYVERPLRQLARYFEHPYVPHAALPRNALDTGYQRGGQRLWLSRDATLAYVGTRSDVEAWPRTAEPLLCD